MASDLIYGVVQHEIGLRFTLYRPPKRARVRPIKHICLSGLKIALVVPALWYL